MKTSIWIDAKQFKFKKVKTPYPAHRVCAHLMIEDARYQSWTMVHGFIFKISGKKTLMRSYAWLEKGSQVYDVMTKKPMKKNVFTSKFCPQATLNYSYKEVRDNMRFYRRYGNWIEGTCTWPGGDLETDIHPKLKY